MAWEIDLLEQARRGNLKRSMVKGAWVYWLNYKRLRNRSESAKSRLMKYFDLAPERQAGIAWEVYGILTGKES